MQRTANTLGLKVTAESKKNYIKKSCNRSSFTELEETLLHIDLDNVLITGDLNARTRDSSDYIWDTAALDNVLDDVSTTELMKMYNIQQDRRSQDVGKNNFGHALIDFLY